MDDTQRIRNFASVARLLAMARRRNLCAWTKAFRAGAAQNALTELNHAGAITLTQYKLLDAWIFWGSESEKAALNQHRKIAKSKPAAAAAPAKVKPKLAAKTVKAKPWKRRPKLKRRSA